MIEQDSNRHLAGYLLVFLLAVGLYANTLGHGFVMDDGAVIGDNTLVQQGIGGIPDILSSPYWSGSGHFENGYRPLSLTTFALEHQFFGVNAFVSHLGNVVLYAITGLVLLSLMRRLNNAAELAGLRPDALEWRWFPLIVALLFIAHPVHTETIANIKSRDEILALLLGLLAIRWLIMYLSANTRRYWVASVVAYGLALLAKESAITFLAVLPLIVMGLRMADWRRMLVLLTPFLALTVLWLLIRQAVLSDFIFDRHGIELLQNSAAMAQSSADRYATATSVLGKYLGLLVYPWPLVYDYSYPQIPIVSWTSPDAWWSLLSIVGLGVVALRFWQRNFFVAAGIVWFFVTISIASNLFVLIGVTMAERLLFSPSVGYSMLLATIIISVAVALRARRAIYSQFLWIAVLFIVAAFGVQSVQRNTDWRSDMDLLLSDIRHAPNSALVRFNYGVAAAKAADAVDNEAQRQQLLDYAMQQFVQAAKLLPAYASAWDAMGQMYILQSEYDQAIAVFGKARALDPEEPVFDAHLSQAIEAQQRAQGLGKP